MPMRAPAPLRNQSPAPCPHFFELSHNSRLTHKTLMAVEFSPLFVKEDLGRNGADAEPLGLVTVLSGVDKDNGSLFPVLLFQLLHDRRHELTGEA